MSGSEPQEHWLDRLAAPHTRRQTFKAALAGVALTLPGVRSTPARAANPNATDPHACRKGCLYTAHAQFARRNNTCLQIAQARQTGALVSALFINPFFGAAGNGAAIIQFDRCLQDALLRQKAMNFDCLQPDCPGFDPAGPRGPCEVCLGVAGAVCCPQQSSSIGYVCCPCCHPSGDGCSSCP